MDFLSLLTVFYILFLPSLQVSIAGHSVPRSHSIIIDGITFGNTLVSQGGTFELGFFSPGGSEKRYLGIWNKNIPIQTVVWVANSLNPINDTSGILILNRTGSLVLAQNSTKTVVWHTSSSKQAQNPVAELLDSGNLVVREEKDANPEAYLWQSFDYPTDALVPDGHNRHLTAWKSPDGPSPGDDCDKYGLCGANGICFITEPPICQCLKGFSPKSLDKWNALDWSEGCVRDTPLGCEESEDKYEDGFFKLVGLKLPDIKYSWMDSTISLEECREKCLNNCSCTAYTNSDIRGEGNGCVMWFGDLNDLRKFPVGGQDLYIRMDISELEAGYRLAKKNKLSFAATIAAVSMILLFGCCYIHQVRRNMIGESQDIEDQKAVVGGEKDMELPLIDMSTISIATDNFSINNKIGQGGFGPVYRGRLEQGQEIAVKRLSKSSEQGMTEFINEVKLIAKLQHRNLIKLLGCCVEENEKLLVYEYMPNGSLDSFIFDEIKGKFLDWSKRFHIIYGIARGLLYLHQDSILMIIHRDLKVSNVLLDEKLNPKISDFGLAKTFKEGQIEGNTNRVVGTCGYMAPEYAIYGQFSTKTDVFSFGILMLEIISGKKNRGSYHPNYTLNLIGHAWLLWKEGRALELVDGNIKDSFIVSEVMRCIHVSLLCVQQSPDDRPAMSNVVLMLGSENVLAEPKQPGFFLMKYSVNSFSGARALSSTNEITISSLEGR